MITYNHQYYIGQAIDSILSQLVDFELELIIGEDKSTDLTRGICLQYAQKFPDKIKLICSDSNVGLIHNFHRTYKACEGKYIAYCEGDDYWTDPLKLQKQIDFLEQNPDYSACFHNVHILNQRNGINSEWPLHVSLEKDSFVTEDVLGPWFIPSPSFVFVNYPDLDLPDWFFNCQYGDLPFMLLLSLRGKFKYLPQVMAVYRLHDHGATTKDKKYDKVIVMAYIYTSFNIHTHYRFNTQIRNAIIYEMDRHVVNSDLPEIKKRNGLKSRLQVLYQNLKQLFIY